MSTSGAYGDPSTRARILDAAWAVMGRDGDITLAGVAQECGVSRQAVYLHFRDRTGLLLALVQHMDTSLDLGRSLAHVFAAPTGAEALDRAVVVHSTFNPGIDAVARFLEGATDDALATAWRDRMTLRRRVHRDIVQRIADDGRLAEGWTVDRAADLFHAVSLPSVWRELVQHQRWSKKAYVTHLTQLLRAAFVKP